MGQQAMTITTMEICFDYISPFAFFGWRRARAFAERRGWELIATPVVFGAMLDHWGQRGPAEIPPKREYTFKTVSRYAVANGIAMKGPKTHPFNTLAALRMSVPLVSGSRQLAIVDALFDSIWVDGIDGSSVEELKVSLERRGFDADVLLARTRERDVKDALRASTDRAIARGAFGVPTFFAGDEMFWGNDSLEWVEMFMDGRDPLDRRHVEEVLARPRGVDRKRAAG